MKKTSLPSSMNFFGLNNDEIKRIMSVIERDFHLREKEFQRIEELRKFIRQEHERVEYLAGSKEFNSSRCIRCFQPFQIFFNPKEFCSICQLFVCHNCANFNKQRRLWTCKLCLKLKELESLTADWFYNESGKKFKRCGGAKIVQELYKQHSPIDEDLGYGTLSKRLSGESKDSIASYVVHDKRLEDELNQYSKRMKFLIDTLRIEFNEHDKRKFNLKNHQQQIMSEISRARTALNRLLRYSKKRINLYENDLQNLLIQKTEELLEINLKQFHIYNSTKANNFEQRLAQIILDRYTKSMPSEHSTPLTREVNEEETKEKLNNCTLIESKIDPPDNDEQDIYTTWF